MKSLSSNSISTLNRRSFIKVSTSACGGLLLSFNGLNALAAGLSEKPKTTASLNAFIKISPDNTVTIFSPNPEIGQNVKTSMPMIVAEELDVDWSSVIVEQAGLNTDMFQRQVAGGSQSIRHSWSLLREAGATARQMLINAAAKEWKVKSELLVAKKGYITGPKRKKCSFGEMASLAAKLPVPEQVALKNPENFEIIGKGTKNIESAGIVVGKPLFGIDTKREGMVYASLLQPPGFGMELKSYDDTEALRISGVQSTVQIDNAIAVVANSTWSAMQGQKALKPVWSSPLAAEGSEVHKQKLLALTLSEPQKVFKKEGDLETGFEESDFVIERTYEAPFLPHNPLEPMNFFAHVTDEKVDLYGPIQTPENTRKQVATALDRPEDEISIGLSRMGGAFGRRLIGDFVIEAAKISNKIRKPVQLVYSREDDMTKGYYRPAAAYKIKGGVKDGILHSYQINGAIINSRNAVRQNNWPYGAVSHYSAASSRLDSAISVMAWRAPIANFLGFAEQVFIDELAEVAGKDPVDFRLESLNLALRSPKDELDYEPDRLMGVIKLAAEKANWYNKPSGTFQGISAYYSHNSYVAEVAQIKIVDGQISIIKIIAAVDCGIVVNPIGAVNQVEGGIIDGIGHAMFGEIAFDDGQPQSNNFNNYRLIRMKEVPKVEVHFIKSTIDPTGLGEPSLPPAAAALANAIYAGTGKRLYSQPFSKQGITLI